jgi:hypothetical protein
MFIVDSQVHIWGADTRERPWPTGRGVEAQKPYPVTKDITKERCATGSAGGGSHT